MITWLWLLWGRTGIYKGSFCGENCHWNVFIRLVHNLTNQVYYYPRLYEAFMVRSFLTLPASPIVRVIFLHQSARASEAGIFSRVPCVSRRLYIPICFGKCSKIPLRKEKKKGNTCLLGGGMPFFSWGCNFSACKLPGAYLRSAKFLVMELGFSSYKTYGIRAIWECSALSPS